MYKIKHMQKDQRGAVSLITVILLILVFSIVTLSFLRLAINDAQQATDTDLNVRALYAAESGVEDGVRVLSDFVSDGVISPSEATQLRGDQCAPATNDSTTPSQLDLSTTLDTSVSCQLIDLTPDDFIKNVGENESVFLPLYPEAAANHEVGSITIEWHLTDPSDATVARQGAGTDDQPTKDCWHTNENLNNCDTNVGDPYAALLRVGLFSHPQVSSGVQRSDMVNRLAYVNPTNGPGIVSVNPVDNLTTYNMFNQASCTSGGAYLCRLEITGLGGQINYLRITPIYKGTDIRITMEHTDGVTALQFANAQAKIDSTGLVNNVSRRIEARVPLNPNDLLPDEAITTAEELCKLISITAPGTAIDNCDP